MSIFLTAKRAQTLRKTGRWMQVLWLITFIFSISFPGWSRESEAPLRFKTSDRTVEQLVVALKRSSLPADLEKAMPMMQARSSAHILRNPQAMLMALKDPEFAKNVPEAKVLLQHPNAVVEAALVHDAAKLDPRTANAMRILALTQGLDRRNIPPSVSPESAKVIETAMNNAVHDINLLDDQIMEDKLKKISPNKQFTEAFNSFMKATDLADTHSFRQTEIAGTSGRKLDPPSKWLEKLEKEKPLSPEELKESKLAKKMSLYLESKNFYADPSKFPTADDFVKLGMDKDFDAKVKGEFKSRAKQLADEAKALTSEKNGLVKLKQSAIKVAPEAEKPAATASHVSTTVGGGADGVAATTAKAAGAAGALAKTGAFLEREIVKPVISAAKGTVALSAAEATVRYVANPDDGIVGALDNTLMATKVTCDDLGCAKFVKECKASLKLPEKASPQEVLNHEHVDVCLNNFFKKPLEEQNLDRRDSAFNKYLSQYSPDIVSLSCNKENGKTIATVETVKSKGVAERHKMIYGQDSSLEKIEDTKPDDVMDRIVFERSAPKLLQHCNGTCKNYELANIKKLKIYPWLDDPKAMPEEKLAGQVPGDSFKWALKSQQIAERQAESIRHCCGNKKCEQAFSSRAPSIKSGGDVQQANSVR